MHEYLWGMLTMATSIAALFFVRYWRLGRDRLFPFLSFAFAAQSASWVALAVIQPSDEHRQVVYLLRLLAFAAIMIGIADKNRRSRVA
jgi:phosphotransferase system  glucose/maltose/N-acetylglucosamine-specific IIC component